MRQESGVLEAGQNECAHCSTRCSASNLRDLNGAHTRSRDTTIPTPRVFGIRHRTRIIGRCCRAPPARYKCRSFRQSPSWDSYYRRLKRVEDATLGQTYSLPASLISECNACEIPSQWNPSVRVPIHLASVEFHCEDVAET